MNYHQKKKVISSRLTNNRRYPSKFVQQTQENRKKTQRENWKIPFFSGLFFLLYLHSLQFFAAKGTRRKKEKRPK